MVVATMFFSMPTRLHGKFNLMKKTLFILFLALAMSLQASANQLSKKVTRLPQGLEADLGKCGEQLTAEIENRKSLNTWVEQGPAEIDGRNFRTPTSDFGRWLELNISAVGLVTLLDVNNTKKEVIAFTPDCKKRSDARLGMDFSFTHYDSGATWFDDKKLEKLVSSGRTGLIYVWSPEMVYSAQYYKYFRDTAKKMGIKFTAVIDPRSKAQDIDRAVQRFGIPPENLKLNSVEIYMRNATVHYPTSVVYAHGKMSPTVIVGVMQKKDIEAQIKNRVAETF